MATGSYFYGGDQMIEVDELPVGDGLTAEMIKHWLVRTNQEINDLDRLTLKIWVWTKGGITL